MAILLYFYLRKEKYIKSLFKGTEAMKQIQTQHSQNNNNNNNTVRPSPRQSSQPSKAASSTVGSFIIKNVPKSVSVNKNTVEESHNRDSSSEASAVVVVGVGGVPTTKVDLSMVDDEDEASGKTCFSIAIFMSRSALDFQISQKKKTFERLCSAGPFFFIKRNPGFFPRFTYIREYQIK